MGGTLLTIEGDGFSPNKFTLTENKDPNFGNWVYIRTRDQSQTFTCQIESTGSNTEKLVCITPNFKTEYTHSLTASINPAISDVLEKMEVFVVADGELSNIKKFSALTERTPKKFEIDTPYGYPDRVIDVTAHLYTRAYNESIPNYTDSPCCQDRCRAHKFHNNDVVCDIYDQDEPGKPVRKYELVDDGKTKQNGNFECKLGGNIMGYQNISWVVTQGYGQSSSHAKNIVGTDGYIHDLVTYPQELS